MSKKTWIGMVAAFGLLGASPVLAQTATSPATDALRTGGCSGCFNTQMKAALATFSQVKRVYRGCVTGPNVVESTSGTAAADCAIGGALNAEIGGKSQTQDFIVIQGDLKNSNTDPNGLGVPGGAVNATYRVSASGSGRGVECAGDPQGGIGFLAPEGLDGAPNTADDAGAGGAFGVPGIPVGWGAANTNDVVNRAALIDCAGNKTRIDQFLSGVPGVVKAAGFTEYCVVNYDQNGDADVVQKADGAPQGSYAAISSAAAGNETTNLELACHTGFADLPPTDFADPSINSTNFREQATTGAQIFKLIVSRDVRARADRTKKIQLWDAQIEGLFAGADIATVCNWKAVGGVSVDVNNVANPSPANANSDVKVCVREFGSGTRETFRNIWMRNSVSDSIEGAPSTPPGVPDAVACDNFTEGGLGATLSSTKTFVGGDTSSQIRSCVTAGPSAIGYVSSSQSATNSYAVPIEGIDPDANSATLRKLVKCGQYRYWGPLSGGIGAASPDGGTAFTQAHFRALATDAVFPTGDYLPEGDFDRGVAFTKSFTDAAHVQKFVANDCDGLVVNPPSAP